MPTCSFSIFFFNDTATTEIYPLPLHAALPIYRRPDAQPLPEREPVPSRVGRIVVGLRSLRVRPARSEEHTSELQSRQYLVCRLLLEKKKNTSNMHNRNPL